MTPAQVAQAKALLRQQISIKSQMEDLLIKYRELEKQIDSCCGSGNLADDDELFDLTLQAAL